MAKLLLYLLRLLVFLLLFFAAGRMLFILVNLRYFRLEEVPFTDVLRVFYYSLRLDLSTACYLLAVPFLLAVIRSAWPRSWLFRAGRAYFFLLILAYALIVTGEAGVYPEWKSKLDYKALHYLHHPEEMAESAGAWQFISLLLLTAAYAWAGTYSLTRWFDRAGFVPRVSRVASLLFLFIVPGFLLLGIRGGIQEIPINQSQSYFSRYNISNHVAVNPGYNLWHSMMESQRYLSRNPFPFYDIREARATVDELLTVEKDTTRSLLTVPRPNVVMIILESWSADLIESLGGEPGITPGFRELEKEGILFTRFFASGNRSQQGLASVFGGFPSLPMTAISNHYNKFVKLPSLVKEMKQEGYHTSFYFGGQLIYGGLRAYILFNGFDKVMEMKDFDAAIPRGRLGIHDQYTFSHLLGELNTVKPPFFATLFTLSTHSPYDQPMDKVLTWGGEANNYINSAYYTDQCLTDFFREARKQDWYDNTLFIILADHSHQSYRNHWLNTREYRKIPLLMAGKVIRPEYRGKKETRIGSQTDVAATLLHQLGMEAAGFHWSRDLMNPTTREFAYFEIQIGVGWITHDGFMAWQKDIGDFEALDFPGPVKDQRIREGKSYLQVLFQQFMDF